MSTKFSFLHLPIQNLSFLMAMMIYAVFGSPTPDIFGFSEVFIALFLVVAVGFSDVKNVSIVALGYGLTLPVIIGIVAGNSVSDLIRDIIPFLFLCLPLFLGWMTKAHPRLVIIAVTSVGLIFSLRTVYAYRDILWVPSLWGQGPPADLLYLANSPEVLFSCLICIGFGGKMMMKKGRQLKGFILILLSIIPLIAMALMTQRAGIGAVIIFVTLCLLGLMYYRPKLAVYFLGAITVSLFLLWPFIGIVFQSLWQKTELVGLNSRAEEWSAVMHLLSQNPFALFFGFGWGGHFENPAVGGLNVNYTHSLMSSLLLKTGVIGTTFILLGCFTGVVRAGFTFLKERAERDYVLMGAVIFPFIISVFLYASYKSLGFGLILLVFSIFLNRKLEKNNQAVS